MNENMDRKISFPVNIDIIFLTHITGKSFTNILFKNKVEYIE